MKSNGAVSPVTRATASSTPVTSPPRAARNSTESVTFQRGEPTASAASRSALGTSSNISSVVRETMGIMIMARANTAAQPEKCPLVTTKSP